MGASASHAGPWSGLHLDLVRGPVCPGALLAGGVGGRRVSQRLLQSLGSRGSPSRPTSAPAPSLTLLQLLFGEYEPPAPCVTWDASLDVPQSQFLTDKMANNKHCAFFSGWRGGPMDP